MLKIDRHFLFLHGEKLAVFAEKVLRNTEKNAIFPTHEAFWCALKQSIDDFRQILSNPFLKRKKRSDALRQTELIVFDTLDKLAIYIEELAELKSDIFTTGFHVHADHFREDNSGKMTRRNQRMVAKITDLEQKKVIARVIR